MKRRFGMDWHACANDHYVFSADNFYILFLMAPNWIDKDACDEYLDLVWFNPEQDLGSGSNTQNALATGAAGVRKALELMVKKASVLQGLKVSLTYEDGRTRTFAWHIKPRHRSAPAFQAGICESCKLVNPILNDKCTA